jgi:hypothetical protein
MRPLIGATAAGFWLLASMAAGCEQTTSEEFFITSGLLSRR